MDSICYCMHTIPLTISFALSNCPVAICTVCTSYTKHLLLLHNYYKNNNYYSQIFEITFTGRFGSVGGWAKKQNKESSH